MIAERTVADAVADDVIEHLLTGEVGIYIRWEDKDKLREVVKDSVERHTESKHV